MSEQIVWKNLQLPEGLHKKLKALQKRLTKQERRKVTLHEIVARGERCLREELAAPAAD